MKKNPIIGDVELSYGQIKEMEDHYRAIHAEAVAAYYKLLLKLSLQSIQYGIDELWRISENMRPDKVK